MATKPMPTTFDDAPPAPVEDERLHSVAEMRVALARERARTNRTGHPFSLLVLTWPDSAGRDAGGDALARVLSARLRLTDEFGWLDADRMGVLLPETRSRAAAAVGRAIASAYPAYLPPLTWRIYVHTRAAHASKGPRIDPPPRGPHPDRPASSPERREEARHADARRDGRMAPLFARPIPRWKRPLDIAGALVGLVVSAPILLASAVLVKLVSPGPAIYRQRRAGLGGMPFTLYKLRTMHPDADARKAELLGANELGWPVFKIARDPRLLPCGRFLRRTSIDELPQLWNVLKGDMSLVGPRPLVIEEADRCVGWQRERLDVKPGLTCTWQVSGRSAIPFPEWARMDIRYARSCSLKEDLTLIVKTVPAVLLRRGAL